MQKIGKYFTENLPVIIGFLTASVLECVLMFTAFSYDFIDYDSSYQYALTQHDIPEIFRLLPYDYSPPFYAIALKLFTMVFGNSLAVMRAFSLVAVIGMLFIAAFPVGNLFGKRSALICVSMTFASGIMMSITSQIRPTIFAMFFYMAAVVYAATAYVRKKRYAYICFTVFSVLSMYTHNIALVGMFCVYVVLLAACLIKKDRKQLKYFFISGCVCAALYLPWLGVILQQISSVSGHFWNANIGFLTTLSWIFTSQMDSALTPVYYILTLIIGAGLMVVFLKHIKFKELKSAHKIRDVFRPCADREKYSGIVILALFIVSAIAMTEVIFLTVRNISSERYCAILGTAWIVLSSALLGTMGNRIINIIIAVSMLFNQCINVGNLMNNVNAAKKYDIVSELSSLFPDGNVSFLHNNEWSIGIMSYYFPDAVHYVCDDTFTVLRTFDVFPVEIVDIGDYHDLWQYTDSCILPNFGGTSSDDLKRAEYSQIVSDLSESGKISRELTFPTVFSTLSANVYFTYISAPSGAEEVEIIDG